MKFDIFVLRISERKLLSDVDANAIASRETALSVETRFDRSNQTHFMITVCKRKTSSEKIVSSRKSTNLHREREKQVAVKFYE